MTKRNLSLYGMIFFLSFFLIVSYFFSTHSVDYASEAETTTESSTTSSETSTSKPAIKKEPSKEEQEMTAFYQKISDTLTSAAHSFNGSVGISYVDLTTGKQLSVNGTQEFYTASTIKVPLTMLIADTVATGAKKWEDQIPYQAEKDYEEGTGIIIYDIKPSYSLRTLQEDAIVYSDNIAKNMLYDVLGGDQKAKTEMYHRYLNKSVNVDDAQFTAEDASTILKKLYQEKETNTEYQKIYDSMKNSVFHERLDTPTTKGKVAHKIGSYDDFIHDMGILEAPHPFILSVFTKGEAGAKFISQLTDSLWHLQTTAYPQTKQAGN